ncbi:glycosyltransferase [Chryseobacterium luquanense]|uniref:Glycosyltransferase n=1 Tax=Chryseobacterium luquanense TaxID=2983766 RepID=A0ABT3Y6M3_9FLAO|nr:glycosyltransferase [Chryseobacterium luquanense]MCX8533631.1 glycosyltransferase [Chryseobacterium luquanense]
MVSQKVNISVALCTYNGEKYLSEQLDSIFLQSVYVDEIVICDDLSTDQTLEVIQSYLDKYPERIKLIVNEQNLGYVKNFEKAISKTTGDLIFLSDQDDIWLKNKVETVLNEFKNHPTKNVFSHDLEILSENGEIIKTSFWESPNFKKQFNNAQILEYLLFEKNVFPGMTLGITKNAKEEYFPLKKINTTIIHDYEIVLKSCNDEKFMIIPEVLSSYRIHEGQNIGFNNNKKPKDDLSEIYDKIKRLKFVENSVVGLNLNPKLYSNYKKKCKSDYKQFISNLSFPKNIITHLKMKYYYKILNF